jgi:tyrocidine synthetase-3
MAYPKSLNKKDVEEILPLTPLQEGMLFHYLSEPESGFYFEQLSLTIKGRIDFSIFKKAWELTAANNEALRTIFRWEKLEKPLQIVMKTIDIPVSFFDCTEEGYLKMEQIRLDDRNKGIDISIEPFRVLLCKLEDCRYEMIVSNHHIILDGWSNGILLKEFLAAYKSISQGEVPGTIKKNRFSEFIKWNKAQDKEKQKAFWKSYLIGMDANPSVIDMPKANYGEMSHKPGCGKKNECVEDELYRNVKSFAQKYNTTLATVLYSVWAVLLKKYSGSDDVVFGTTISGREIPVNGIDKMAGLFINTLPLRIYFNEELSFLDVINKIDTMLVKRKPYESACLADISIWHNEKNNNPIFDTLLVVENYPLETGLKDNGVLDVEGYSMFETTNFNLSLEIEAFDSLNVHFTYNRSLYSEAAIKRIGKHYVNALKGLVSKPNNNVDGLNILSPEETQKVIYEFNRTEYGYDTGKTVNCLFEEQVEKTPHNTALIFKDIRLTYSELNDKVNCFAHVLRSKGVGRGTIVGLMIARSVEMIVAMLAVMKAGGAYLPIDTEYPIDRINYVLKDSGALLLVANSGLSESLNFEGEIIRIKNIDLCKDSGTDLKGNVRSDDVAYVIYTSGSTGNPKGVMIEHRAINNFILGVTNEIPFKPQASILALTTISFDIFVLETLLPLAKGLTIVLCDEIQQTDPRELNDVIVKNNVSMLQLTPSRLQMLINDSVHSTCLKSMETIMVGGEAFPELLLNKLKSITKARIFNMYGPTETTVWSLIKDLSDENKITIGKPIANQRVYILDKSGNPLPIGVNGELYIAGNGLARGYLKRTELSNERFVPEYRSEADGLMQKENVDSDARMYKTGDLARWLDNGEIEFIGRVDYQVKIRGYRIELGEIENCMLGAPGVLEAAACAFEDNEGNKYICGYYTWSNEIEHNAMHDILAKSLPEYMIPSFFIGLEHMPHTPNNKIDRKALPAPVVSEIASSTFEPPSNITELKLKGIWENVLGVDNIGVNSSFFEMGGHSLKATILVSKINKELEISVPVKEIFRSPTIRKLSMYIDSVSSSDFAAIERVDEREYYTASPAQKRMFLLWQLEPYSVAYNMTGAISIEGKLDYERMKEIFHIILKRHESLRTSFKLIDGQILQRVSDNTDADLQYMEFKEDNIEQVLKSLVRPFDLEKAPLIRAVLIKCENERHILFVDMHHIISDGSSLHILIKELMSFYAGLELPEAEVRYRDFSVWQENRYSTGRFKNQENYWIKALDGDIPVLDMPLDFKRPGIQNFLGDVVSFKADRALTEKVRGLAQKTGTTVFMTLLAAYNALLHIYTAQKDIIVGIPVSGRHHPGIENVIGMFVNTLPVRNYPVGDMSFHNLLHEVRENLLYAMENQDYQVEEIIERLNLKRDLSRNPLFDTVFTMLDDLNNDSSELNDIKINTFDIENGISKFDLSLSAYETNDEILFKFEFSSSLFKNTTIERLSSHLLNIIGEISENPYLLLSDIKMLSDAERNQVIYDFNRTGHKYEEGKTIQELFEECAEANYERVAVAYKDEYLTYGELDRRSNRLARVLREKGVGKDVIVALMIERSIDMVVGVMGILKAGGAYLPIDLSYPQERIKFIIDDSSCEIILCSEDNLHTPDFSVQIVDISEADNEKKPDTNINCINKPDDCAYIIYTSGSTGKPKGVVVGHKGIANLKEVFKDDIGLNSSDRMLQFASSSFDASVLEMFMALLNGAALYIVNKEIIEDYSRFEDFLNKNQITAAILPPTYLIYLKPENVRTLKMLMTGGSVITPDLMRQWKDHVLYINGYGPTEITVCATMWKYCLHEDRSGTVPIGRPLYNMKTYVVGRDGRLQPVGVPGELWISGAGLAHGYLNRPELTEDRFTHNPFEAGERVYKTGDLVRWLEDGNLEFLGRIDNQVKIRGYRIELGEIENVILRFRGIKDVAVVDLKDGKGESYLCAYLVEESNVEISEMQRFLSEYLPYYMIPSYFVKIDSMPLNQSGKVNKKLLPDPIMEMDSMIEPAAPENEMELKLVEIWEDVLGRSMVGVNDNFFELGGHSLKASALISHVNTEFNAAVPMKEFFARPTIKELAAYISGLDKVNPVNIKLLQKNDYYFVSPVQKRLYLLGMLDSTTTAYNIPCVISIEGKLDLERFKNAFSQLAKRHESLRTSFKMIDDEPVQIVHDDICFNVNYFENGNENADELVKEFVRPFDLEKAPLFRIAIIRNGEDRYFLVMDFHHIIFDGLSLPILFRDLIAFYKNEELMPLKFGYKEYAAWQKDYLDSQGKKQEEFWLQTLNEEIPVLDLPADFIRPSMQSFEGNSIKIDIDSQLAGKLRELTVKTGTTMYMVLLAGFYTLLYKYTGQTTILVGTPAAGRSNLEIKDVIGMFVNTLVIKANPDSNKTFFELLDEVKRRVLEAFENQDYPFEEIVEKLQLPRDISRNPLFDVMFSMLSIDVDNAVSDDIVFTPCEVEHGVSKFDITLSALELGDSVFLSIEYCTQLFKRDTIERMLQNYINILNSAAQNPSSRIADIEVISTVETQKVMVDFNNTGAYYPEDKTIAGLFQESVEKFAKEIALVSTDTDISYTYSELNERANRLAHTIRGKGMGTGQIVGILLERSIEMIVGIMAITKAGGAYLPIHPSYPADRVKYMIDDSKAAMILTTKHLAAMVLNCRCSVLLMDSEDSYSEDGTNLTILNTAHDPAYVIYTSGSTGKPKGVMISQRSAINILTALQRMYPMLKGDSFLFKTTFTFDVSVAEIFGWFQDGGRLVILEKDGHSDPVAILRAIEKYSITHINFVPSMFNMFLDIAEHRFIYALGRLKFVILAGEAVSKETVKRFRAIAPDVGFKNLYGPTEAAIYATAYDLEGFEEGLSVPIGKPVQNVRAYIFNKDMQMQPVGVPGELYIGGHGLAEGYVNMEELTREKFVMHPYIDGERLYKTGDLARFLPNGDIEFLGRLDFQVKIRGFRIELGEIESLIHKHESVKDAVVIALDNCANEKQLCAYYVAENEISSSQFKEYLSKSLPDYMIPLFYIRLEEIPLNRNGKADRKALPVPLFGAADSEAFEMPFGEMENSLAAIWMDVLNISRVGRKDNFFELGGHSLKAASVAGRIYKDMNIEVKLADIFKFPELHNLAKQIESMGKINTFTIEASQVTSRYPLSKAQHRMYVLWELDRESTVYNIPGALMIEGNVNPKVLEKALCDLIIRHEILRTSYKNIDGEIFSIVHVDYDFNMEFEDASLIESMDINEIVKAFVRPFNLNDAPLMRAKLYKVSDSRHIMLFDVHHIACDGVSFGLLIDEFTSLLEGSIKDAGKLQYRDFALWQNGNDALEYFNKHEDYWLDALKGEINALNIPSYFQSQSYSGSEGDSYSFELDSRMTGRLKDFAQNNNLTLYSLLLSVYNILLYKYTGQEDIIVGSPVSGRTHPDLEKMIGMFVNTIPMRNHIKSDGIFCDLAAEVHKNTAEALSHQDYPVDELIDRLHIEVASRRKTLYDTVFSMQKVEKPAFAVNGMTFTALQLESNLAKFDLTFIALDKDQNISVSIEYRPSLFKREIMEKMAGHFVNIINDVLGMPDKRISAVNMLSDKEKQEIINGFNNTSVDYALDTPVHELFRRQAEKEPGNIAIAYTDEETGIQKFITYGELNILSDRLAGYLKSKGAGPEFVAAVMTDLIPEMIIGLMAILKSGAAFLPIDPAYGKERIEYILKDSGAGLLLSTKNLCQGLVFEGGIVDLKDSRCYTADQCEKDSTESIHNMAYMIYTSGTTGRPKGVIIEHGSLVNLCLWHVNYYKVDAFDRALKYAGVGFDASVWEIFPYLVKGAGIYLVNNEDRLDIKRLKQYFIENSITIAFLPTQVCEQFMGDEIPGLKRLLTGGDKLRYYKAGNYDIFNNYGPTENTVVTTCFKLDGQYSNIPIGKPIDNSRVYILDRDMNILPAGIPGELCISGAGLARGYHNRYELTLEKFVDNPFENGSRMYRTGDLARWNKDGNIEFLGRIDTQIKLRGFRIEIGEIETSILGFEGIDEVAVLLKEEGDSDKYLCAYIVKNREIDIDQLRGYLLSRLPVYMVPSAFAIIDKIPLTANGKVNRKELMAIDCKAADLSNYVAPRTPTEIKLVELLQDVLGIEQIGIRDNFFNLGGHSLKAPVLASRISEVFEVEMPVKNIFMSDNFEMLAQMIDTSAKSTQQPITNVEMQDYYELSSAQKRIFILNRLYPGNTSYNIYGSLEIEGELSREILEDVLDKLVERHETLRTSFHMVQNRPVQKIHEPFKFKVEYMEASEETLSATLEEFVRPFDLSCVPLLRVGLVSINKHRCILVFDMHHIVSDGISANVLMDDFSQLYAKGELQPLKIQYKDYAAWQNSMAENYDAKDYCMNVLDNFVYTRLPGIDTTLSDSSKGSRITCVMDNELYLGIKTLCTEYGSTKPELILALFNIAIMNELGGIGPVTLGMPVAGRSRLELEKLIGMFLNVQIITTKPWERMSFKEYMEQIRDVMAEARDNQDYPYEDLYDAAREKLGVNHEELYTIMYNYLPYRKKVEINIDDICIKPYNSIMTESKNDITLYVGEEPSSLRLDLVFKEALFEKSRMQNIVDRIIECGKKILENRDIVLDKLISIELGETNAFVMDFDNLLDNDEFLV